jgi:hypothetical protein
MCYQENQNGYLQMAAARGNNFAEKLQEHLNVCGQSLLNFSLLHTATLVHNH